MGIVKAHRYEVRSNWLGGRRLALDAPEKPSLEVATPPDFKDGVHGVWSPEELLVGSLATCLELTLVAMAEHRGVPLTAIDVDAAGQLERKAGRFRFVVLELDVRVETEVGHEDEAAELVRLAKENCIIGEALSPPVLLTVDVRVPDRIGAAAA
jgi:organic hydroperoxide reductase OsmC/OhrA